MAKIVNNPKLTLTQKELDTLKDARKIIAEIAEQDKNGVIFNKVDSLESEFWYVFEVIENLENIAEVE